MAELTQEQQFVEYMVKGIVEHPEDVTTERIEDDMGILVSLHVNSADMGTIIGKEGRTAKALRTLLRVMGAKHNQRVNLKIIEPEGGRMAYNNATPADGGDDMAMPSHDLHLSDALKDVPQDELA